MVSLQCLGPSETACVGTIAELIQTSRYAESIWKLLSSAFSLGNDVDKLVTIVGVREIVVKSRCGIRQLKQLQLNRGLFHIPSTIVSIAKGLSINKTTMNVRRWESRQV